jgi:XapX domain-containing protein
MAEVLLALATSAFVDILFSVLKLPLPAIPVISGIAGIAGIYLGGIGYQWIVKRFFN